MRAKQKTMVISRNEGTRADIQVDGKSLEQVNHFKYLGQTVSDTGKNIQEIKIRIAQAKSTFIQMSDILTSRDISLALRLKAVSMYIYPIVLYGDESWTWYKDCSDKIEAFEMWIYRKMARISYTERVKNEDVLKRLKVKRELLNKSKSHKLSYFGHIVRHESIQKTVLEGRMEGRRGRGRPRRQWVDDIKDWSGKQLRECTRLAQDRVAWRRLARRPRENAARPRTARREDT